MNEQHIFIISKSFEEKEKAFKKKMRECNERGKILNRLLFIQYDKRIIGSLVLLEMIKTKRKKGDDKMLVMLKKGEILGVRINGLDDNQKTPFKLIVKEDGKLYISIGTSDYLMKFDDVVYLYRSLSLNTKEI